MVIGGDFNCNVLEVNTMTNELLLLLESNIFKNVISEPMHITLEAETLLDLLITQAQVENIKAGVIENTVSDHLPIYMFLKAYPQCNKIYSSSTVLIEDITDTTLSTFRERITLLNWHYV
ncbi:hypothetical protein HPB48_017524 [Haemaphysalis longicornis]|uniref:Uncharacterized protein n=1 Tax=Haemaphysalis longicornis TaxID=44386 RepID=A0A9J6GXN7_HAELO|nr:hypothetical protein HPB48_017524 [Haemaphysalis longicornis]